MNTTNNNIIPTKVRQIFFIGFPCSPLKCDSIYHSVRFVLYDLSCTICFVLLNVHWCFVS